MHITQEMRQQACEGAFAFHPEEGTGQRLGVSVGSIRDWAIYIQHGFFDWVDKPWVTRRPELLKAPSITGSSITPLATAMLLSSLQFGVRPVTLFQKIRRTVTKLPEQLRPSASYSGTSNQKPALEPSEWPSKNSPTFLPIVP